MVIGTKNSNNSSSFLIMIVSLLWIMTIVGRTMVTPATSNDNKDNMGPTNIQGVVVQKSIGITLLWWKCYLLVELMVTSY
jgi:hypothetical protein